MLLIRGGTDRVVLIRHHVAVSKEEELLGDGHVDCWGHLCSENATLRCFQFLNRRLSIAFFRQAIWKGG